MTSSEISGPILEMRGITKTFPGVRALDDVNLTVDAGTIHAVCGENGAGKSTLMKVLSGVYPSGSYEGSIVFAGEPVTFRTIRDSEALGIVIIHQELALSPHLSIGENIFLGNERTRRGVIDWDRTHAMAARLLSRVGLSEKPETIVSEIGVGKQQLVEIAKALSKEVRLLILDEPTAALNDDDSEHLLSLLAGLREEGVTSIIISHKLNEIRAIADAVTIIRDGKTIETIDAHGQEPLSEDRIITGMVGRSMEHRYPDREHRPGEEMLRVEDWTVHHPVDVERTVVDGASLNVRAGEVVGIAGLMGAGRTELAMSLFGRQYGRNISGRVFKQGQEIFPTTVGKAKRAGLAYVSEDRKRYGLNLIGEIRHNASSANLPGITSGGFLDLQKETLVAEGYRKSMNVRTPSVVDLVGKLSGGNQQKVVLGKWMFTDPDVLILDEPTRGIDVGAKYEIYSIINELVARGKAVLMISSELPELLGMSDRIYTINEGRITGEVARAEATQETLMRLMTTELSTKEREATSS